jgi:hydroxymethylglutaryl-CoA reductase (NADPH)
MTGEMLCGEVSLGAAVVADEWVTAHERLGRNRP